MAHIKNKWIILGTSGAKYPFNSLAEAKHYCVGQTAFIKENVLYGGKIIHVVDDEIISEVTIDKFVDSNDMVLFSDVHIYHKPVAFNLFEDLEKAIMECCDSDYELSNKPLDVKAKYIFKIVLDMIELKK